MPSRYVREGLLSSEAIATAGELAEVLFVRLLLVADDFGRFDGRVGRIVRACWPAGGVGSPGEFEVNDRLEKLEAAGLVLRYEVDGKPFLLIPRFQQRTRSTKSKFPEPSAAWLAKHNGAQSQVIPSAGHSAGKWRAPA